MTIKSFMNSFAAILSFPALSDKEYISEKFEGLLQSIYTGPQKDLINLYNDSAKAKRRLQSGYRARISRAA